MRIRRLLTAGIAAGLLVLTGCGSSGSSTPNADASTTGGGSSSSSDIRIDVITHGAPGDSFWDVVKSGAEQAGKDEGVAFYTRAKVVTARWPHVDLAEHQQAQFSFPTAR